MRHHWTIVYDISQPLWSTSLNVSIRDQPRVQSRRVVFSWSRWVPPTPLPPGLKPCIKIQDLVLCSSPFVQTIYTCTRLYIQELKEFGRILEFIFAISVKYTQPSPNLKACYLNINSMTAAIIKPFCTLTIHIYQSVRLPGISDPTISLFLIKQTLPKAVICA